MKAVVQNYKGSHKTQYTNRVILKAESVDKKDAAEKLVGKKVSWLSPSGKKLEGEITKTHGNSGAVLAKFTPNLPGQALGTTVIIA